MSKKDQVFEVIASHGVLPLYYHDDPQRSVEVLEALYEAGIRAVEYADRGDTALENFGKLKEVRDTRMADCFLGIGTIKNVQSARNYIEAGADFIVCPGLVESVAVVAADHDLLWVPGCLTPTEIIRAEELGAGLVKLYPLNTLGTPFLGAIRAVFPDLRFMPTGGISMDEQTVRDWILAGVTALGGSRLISPEILRERSWEKLTRDTRQLLDFIHRTREMRDE